MRRNLGVAIGVLAIMTTLSSCGPTGEVSAPDLETSSAAVNPGIWPEITSPVEPDPEIEDRITALLEAMTVEDKVGQIVQGEIRNLTPEDVRKYRLGSVLNGGGSHPGNQKRTVPADWLFQRGTWRLRDFVRLTIRRVKLGRNENYRTFRNTARSIWFSLKQYRTKRY